MFAKFLFMLLFAKTRMGKDVVQGIKEKGLDYGAMSAHEAFSWLIEYLPMLSTLNYTALSSHVVYSIVT